MKAISSRAFGRYSLAVALTGALCAGGVGCTTEHARSAGGSSGFAVVENGRSAGIQVCSTNAAPVVTTAAKIVTGDLARLGGTVAADRQIFVGVVGEPAIERLAAGAKVDLRPIAGKWEHYLIATVDHPAPGVKCGLLVVGSDARGAAFGLMDLLEQAGVSPWSWWADVPVAARANVVVPVCGVRVDGPKVKFRGLFINDEDFGLLQWAKKTYEPENGSIGPKTYAKGFELLLRLKANTLWPAMHPVTKSFNTFRENPKLAAEYGIVMGSSHCEPLLTNNAEEWTKADGEWSWDHNREGILKFLRHRVEENGSYDNLYTIGMRGIHDTALKDGGTLDEKTKRLEDIFAAERQLLAPLGGGDPSKVPQVFIPYKEVLDIYNNGLKVPDDVTLMWVDDNHGWIRRLPNEQERKRSGGGGVYYHLSYWGGPQSYLWLDSTAPAMIWEEMTKAYAYGVDRIWIVNVGDIKSIEKGTDYFLRLAWNPKDPVLSDQSRALTDFSRRTFGDEHAKDIASVLDMYYRLSWGNRPEQIGRSVPNDELLDPNYAARYMDECDALQARAEAVGRMLPASMQDAYFELVQYPISGMTGTAVKVLAARESRRVVEDDPAKAGAAADRSEAAWNRILTDTQRYNDIGGGKWAAIMDNQPLPRNEVGSSSLTKPAVARHPGDMGREKRPAPEQPIRHLAPSSATLKSTSHAFLKALQGLGTDGSVLYVEPRTLAAVEAAEQSPAAQWRFDSSAGGEIRLVLNALPTHNPAGTGGVRCAVQLNDGPLQWIEFPFAHHDKEWSNRVLTMKMSAETKLNMKPGPQVLTLYPMGSNLVLDSVDLFQP